jgi:hypothetical protein
MLTLKPNLYGLYHFHSRRTEKEESRRSNSGEQQERDDLKVSPERKRYAYKSRESEKELQ